MLILPANLEEAIRRHAEREYPNECCGALLGAWNRDGDLITDIRRLRNVHDEGHERRYLVDPVQLRELLEEESRGGSSIIGFYHSHPDHPARPSEYDRVNAAPWYTYAIVAVSHGASAQLTAWKLDDDNQFAEEPIGRGGEPHSLDRSER